MSLDEYVPSIINPRTIKKECTLTQSTTRRLSLSLRRSTRANLLKCTTLQVADKENIHPNQQSIFVKSTHKNNLNDFSGMIDQLNVDANNLRSDSLLISEFETKVNCSKASTYTSTELYKYEDVENSTGGVISDLSEMPYINVSLSVNGCDKIDISSKNNALKRVVVSNKSNETFVDCQLIELDSPFSEYDANEKGTMDKIEAAGKKVEVIFDIKNRKQSENVTENSKVLILKTNAIEKLKHVIVQPPYYKLVKRKISDNNILNTDVKKKAFESAINNGSGVSNSNLIQIKLDSFFKTGALTSEADIVSDTGIAHGNVGRDVVDMSKKSGVADAVKYDRVSRSFRSAKNNDSPRSIRLSTRKDNTQVPQASPKTRNHSASSHTPSKVADSTQFNLPSRCQSNKTSACPRIVPHHKIIAGTHFAVDAFSYGEIPNVNNYFLTHFHSDHYSGLKKSFKKTLFCSKITADLCMMRLGVNPKFIHVMKVDETLRIEGVEVTALEANHCPGAIMLVFTLPNGKTLLHTGDFRASHDMESYPIFWNMDIHTIYLDTTYCNPRYDFPTQVRSLEIALDILREKKLSLEKVGRKFSSVLIICGTYTIGKEKFFLGLARRVGCSVWACPEKDRVLQIVAGRSFSHAPPRSCQLHVVPMRDLTHEKLRSYLDSLDGAFGEVVAFKPSGWENGKNSSVEKDSVTIHGIPYSEHSSFSEMIRFVKFLKPTQVIPTVDISGGVKSVQKYFPCPLVYKEDTQCQSKLTDYFSVQKKQQMPAVT